MPTIKSLSAKIKDKACLAEIGRRQLTKALAETYLQQAFITPNRINALAFRNDAGGHEIYHRNAELHQEKSGTIGPAGVRTLPASPGARSVAVFVYVHFWDFLTRCHLYGLPKPEEMHVITNGQTKNAADAIRNERRTGSILFFGNGVAEHVFIEALDSEIDTQVAAIEDLSEAYMDQPESVRRAIRAPEYRPDQSAALSVSMRLRYTSG
ncbi:hypothetical protein J0X19_11845 [Hymenobacter sp. BT186]|uniref:Uncharacterized protein n=1 Tax=Hymenobacter telluris TaxID=2816474 RepID=A0A939EXZ5_9BACT|nr:hypothetical protein [Hymenobacter telluris]MBO0358640.1 hypothetical protein [Hymenobacter telluris]MBW3374666.1 hypothetical protein [Hymenobacter norwichensis]